MKISKKTNDVYFKKNEPIQRNSIKKIMNNDTFKTSNMEDNMKKILPELEDQYIIKSSLLNNILV